MDTGKTATTVVTSPSAGATLSEAVSKRIGQEDTMNFSDENAEERGGMQEKEETAIRCREEYKR